MKGRKVICFLIVCFLVLVCFGTVETEAAQPLATSGENVLVKDKSPDLCKVKKKPTKKPKEKVNKKKKKSKGNNKSQKKKSYSPSKVVKLATKRVKAMGKIYIPDDLKKMLKEGKITKKEYKACYPTDGAGYIEYYVAADLNEARDISGTVQFKSESDIAKDIAKMYQALPQKYFYIKYHGTVMYGSKKCYVFYCYRA